MLVGEKNAWYEAKKRTGENFEQFVRDACNKKAELLGVSIETDEKNETH